MTRKQWGIIAALALAIPLVIQYPLQTTFPIGGDATRYIFRVERVIKAAQTAPIEGLRMLATNSWYPGAISILALSKLTPLSWPDRFVWWMVLGHLATVGMLGLLLYRVGNWRIAAAGIATWPLVINTMTHHIEDGTLAQLWSLPAVLLFLFALSQGSTWGTLGALVLTFLIHPMSGIVCVCTLMMTLVAAYPVRRTLKKGLARTGVMLAPVALIIAVGILSKHQEVFATITAGSEYFSIPNALTSPYGPLVLMSLLGVVILARRYNKSPLQSITLLSFIALATLLTFNDKLGIQVYVNRLQTYFAISTTIAAAYAVPWSIRHAFNARKTQWAAAGIFFITLSTGAWHENARVFHAYESPSRYMRLHQDEQEAIAWMKENMPDDSFIITTEATRNLEWIPILSGHQWMALDATDPFWEKTGTQLRQYNTEKHYTHFVFFTRVEKPEETFPEDVENFPTIFENKGVRILKLQNGE